MAPVVHALDDAEGIESCVCVTAQHRGMLDQVLELFDIRPDVDLDIMKENQDLTHITSAVLEGVSQVISETNPDRILVHGDTTTSFAAALAAFYHKVPVGHVEAGLRTGDTMHPWPEEMNRRLVDAISDVFFAPTESARANLLAEGVDESKIEITGNTVIDALFMARDRLASDAALFEVVEKQLPDLDPAKRVILVTGHRRENFGQGFEQICHALEKLASRNDIEIVYPVHLNPNVRDPVNRILGGHRNIHLIEPLPYLPFVHLMGMCHFVISDSGGIQEEAPSLGKPVLVTRSKTERPEAVEAGTVKLVGTVTKTIIDTAESLLDDQAIFEAMSQAHNPYGDGLSAGRIVDRLLRRKG